MSRTLLQKAMETVEKWGCVVENGHVNRVKNNYFDVLT